MKKVYLGLSVILLILLLSVPIQATEDTSSQQEISETVQITQVSESDSQIYQQDAAESSGGLKPISPEKVKAKVDAIESWVVALMAPIIHLLSKLSLILAVLLILVAVFARDLIGKAFMLILCVTLGMAIFTNVGGLTDGIQWAGQWLGQ